MTELTSAAELAAAAQKLRKLAEAATPGPWVDEVSPVHGFRVGTADRAAWVAFTGDYADEPEESGPDAAWIAALHPGVGLALAGWLREVAQRVERVPSHATDEPEARYALAVARAVLGSGT